MRDMNKKRAYCRAYYKEKLNGFRGSYKGKRFVYRVRLPEGAVRHHLVYDDKDPDYGIIFCTPEYHLEIHRDPINGQNGGRNHE